MSDGLRLLLWMGILGGGLGLCVALKRAGVRTTYVRDLLHLGAGVWVLGFVSFRATFVPVTITTAAAVALLLLPVLAARVRPLAAIRDSVSDGDERWQGIVLYAVAFALFTALAQYRDPARAGAALWALTLGDGLGGAFGRRFGRHHFTAAGGKRKSLEGSIAVALFAGLGAWLAARWLGGVPHPVLAGLTAAVAEALSPRGMDNLIVPAAVYAALWSVS